MELVRRISPFFTSLLILTPAGMIFSLVELIYFPSASPNFIQIMPLQSLVIYDLIGRGDPPLLISAISPNRHNIQFAGKFLECGLSVIILAFGLMRRSISAAGSSDGSCGTSFPCIARSRILDLVKLIVSNKLVVVLPICSINPNHLWIFDTIRSCSSIGGKGIGTSSIFATDSPGCAVDVAY